jgi:hypothetical protein
MGMTADALMQMLATSQGVKPRDISALVEADTRASEILGEYVTAAEACEYWRQELGSDGHYVAQYSAVMDERLTELKNFLDTHYGGESVAK